MKESAVTRKNEKKPEGEPLQAGTIVSLPIVKEVSPYGYFLSNGMREVLLHYSETFGELKVGDTVEVFLFHDTEDRLAATMKRPLLTLGELGLLEVVDIHPRLGCFLDFGLGRHLLLPLSELPQLKSLYPVVGDRLFVVMEQDRQGRLVARLAGESDLAPRTFPAPSVWKNQWVKARVYHPLQDATFVIVEGGVLGFGVLGMIHHTERTRPLRLGEQVRVRVTFVREDGRVNLSMRPLKEIGREEDAARILRFLLERPNGAMPYSDETPAEIIKQKFNISKAAFKRAMGKLMKDGAVVQKGSWTYLRKDYVAKLQAQDQIKDLNL